MVTFTLIIELRVTGSMFFTGLYHNETHTICWYNQVITFSAVKNGHVNYYLVGIQTTKVNLAFNMIMKSMFTFPLMSNTHPNHTKIHTPADRQSSVGPCFTLPSSFCTDLCRVVVKSHLSTSILYVIIKTCPSAFSKQLQQDQAGLVRQMLHETETDAVENTCYSSPLRQNFNLNDWERGMWGYVAHACMQ